MNLVLNTDVNATNRKLKEYQKANNIKVDKNLDDNKSKSVAKRAREDGNADPSGLIQGLKKIEAPPPVADYDPFEGMPTSYDYFDLKDDYVDILHPNKPQTSWAAGGYNFMVSQFQAVTSSGVSLTRMQESVEESLMSAFAGLGVFLEDEKARTDAASVTNLQAPLAAKPINDVF